MESPVQISLGDATALLSVLQKLVQERIAAHVAYLLMRNMAVLTTTPAVIAAEELRTKLVTKYGERDPNTNQIRVLPENLEAFSAEYQAITAEKVDVSFRMLPESALEELPDLSPLDMLMLRPILGE